MRPPTQAASENFLFGVWRGARRSRRSLGSGNPGRSRGTSGTSGTSETSGTLSAGIAFRSRRTGWPLEATGERQAGYKRNSCSDTHPVFSSLIGSRNVGPIRQHLRPANLKVKTGQ
jgi:hypothetical protein